jgi:hypothetical protein
MKTMRHGWAKDYEMMRPLDGLPPSGIAFVDTISHDDEELRRRRNEELERVAEEIAQKAALRVEESRRKRDDACRARLLAKKLRDAEKAKQIARESVVEMTTDELAKFDSEVILLGADEAIMRLNQRHKNKLAIAENAKKLNK